MEKNLYTFEEARAKVQQMVQEGKARSRFAACKKIMKTSSILKPDSTDKIYEKADTLACRISALDIQETGQRKIYKGRYKKLPLENLIETNFKNELNEVVSGFLKMPKTTEALDSIDKWELLKTIEKCRDLKKSTKKALLNLVWDETT